jgi:UDP-2,4-diacetamido-2,4,6-trideoxy-beta-L-altropyranose hydrolase
MTGPKPTVLFRVDASTQIGTGHVMRCLTLAAQLRDDGAEVRFISREHEGHLCALVEAQGFVVHRLSAPRPDWTPDGGLPVYAAWLGADWGDDARETLAAIGEAADWLVVDHYGIEARWEQALRPAARRIMVIDDLADRSHDCDLLLDQNPSARFTEGYRALVPQVCTMLLGSPYALLKPDYAMLRRRASPRSGKIGRILVSFGGVDRDGLTLRTVNALLALGLDDVACDIVLSSGSPQFQDIRDRISGNSRFVLHDRVPTLAPLILAADLAIGASGTTNWERLCLGLPAIVVTVADNQRPMAEELHRRQLIRWLGDAAAIDDAGLQAAIEQVMRTGIDTSWSERCLAVVDGLGAQRVSAALMAGPGMDIVYRHAELSDEALLLDWANDATTRRNAFNPKPIAPDEHSAWFQARLRQPALCMLLIAETATGVPLGQVRFDRRDD